MKNFDKNQINIVEELTNFYGDYPVFFLKFVKEKKYAEDICEGKFYLNTIKYFRDLEEKTKKRGQGDKNEVIASFHSSNIKFLNKDNNDVLMELNQANCKMNFKSDDSIAMICFVGIPISKMQLLEYNEYSALFQFPFTDKEYQEMNEEFGEYCTIFSGFQFRELLYNELYKNNIAYRFERVKYTFQNDINRIKSFVEGNVDRFFYKDLDLSYQREWRLIVDKNIKDDHYLRLSPLKEIKYIESKKLKNLVLQINYTLGEK